MGSINNLAKFIPNAANLTEKIHIQEKVHEVYSTGESKFVRSICRLQ